jgi:SAM-dependent methyltransferase
MISPYNKRPYLNLACGTRMHRDWVNLDFSPYAKLAKWPKVSRLLRSVGFLSRERYERLLKVDSAIISHDLRNELPFPANTFEVVYHSHFLEHLDRTAAQPFLRECRRVLRPGGILRIALPDLRKLTEWYLQSYGELRKNNCLGLVQHQKRVGDLFEQMVRVESEGSRHQSRIVRILQKILAQDARALGELHRWMYDFFTLKALLEEAGFSSVQEQTAESSAIPDWTAYGLDTNPDGTIYKPESLFVEARK